MLLEALSRDDDRIAQVGRIAREQAHAAGVPRYYIDAAFERAAIIALVRSGFDDGFIRHLHPDCNGDRHDPRV